MRMNWTRNWRSSSGVVLLLMSGLGLWCWGADHADTPLLVAVGRHDARLTDFFAFTRGENLVLILCSNPAIPPGVSDYRFPSDLTFRVAIDNDSEVSFDSPDDVATYGGTVVRPDRISEDIVLEVSFGRDGGAKLKTEGLPGAARKRIRLFTGLRDDPFIRGPRIGRNVAAIVMELPLSAVTDLQPTLLLWGTAKAPEIHGPISELAGRSLRSMFGENDLMNTLHPKHHASMLGVPPDVMIFDTSEPAQYPNGRLLTDDVVDLVGDSRILDNDAPFPTENDVRFLDDFPYLAPPQ